MGSYFVILWCPMLIILFHTQLFILASHSGQLKCHPKEKQSLLTFIQGLYDPSRMLSTWTHNTDCCQWTGIQCNNETGHVTMLHLGGGDDYLRGEINITSLIELQYIEYFDLSCNFFLGSQIPKQLGSFSNLRYLNFSSSAFGGRIPDEIGNLSKLEYLSLDGNFLIGAIPSQLGKLTRLRYLDLSFNDIDREIPYQLGNLSQLQHLDLRGISGEIPFQIGNLPMLNTLKLDNLKINKAQVGLSALSFLTNLHLSYSLPLGPSHQVLQTISKLIPNLRELRLSHCSLLDNDILYLFPFHSNFSTPLTILDLSLNMLTSSTFQFLSNFTLSLQELYISNNNIVLSSPLYLKFPSLVILDISYNNLTSLTFQGNLNFSFKLQKLNMGNCGLMDKSFPLSFAFIVNSTSSLVSLDLSSNMLKSSTIFHWLSNFTTNLYSLFLYSNMLEGPIPHGFREVMNSLEVLSLSSNKLQGQIPPSFRNICTLQELYLHNNNLSGQISDFIENSSSCNNFKFQILDLSYNQITGMLPKLSIFSSLRRLDLSNNQLIGEIPESIGLLYRLEYLHLEENHLEGDIIELHFTNLYKLASLDLSHNSLSPKFGTSWVPPFQLYSLGLASCKLGPDFPSWLQTQSQLNFLDISQAGINDFVPDWFWSKLQTMRVLNMSNNNLIGEIPNLPLKLDKVDIIQGALIFLNSNQFEGRILAFLSQACILDLSNNKVSDMNTFLCVKSTTKTMRILDLSSNQIMGKLPDCWESLNSLQYLDLSNNNISGKIPQSMGQLFSLEGLVLRNNNLIGELPCTLKNCSNIIILDMSENSFSGTIPSWIGENLQNLKILSLRVNRFFGSFPPFLCYLRQIQLLDLSRNNLSKGIPTCLKNYTTLMEMKEISSEIERTRKVSSKDYYEDTYEPNVLLMWKGTEHVYLNPEIFLKSIDLSSNNLTGEIPKEVGYLLGLVSLNLSRNNLSGAIPSEIGDLKFLEFLDLSKNHFSGNIPYTLSKIDRLSMLDLSYNSLTGRIPLGRQLQTFDATQFEGNLDLCGEPLSKTCPVDETTIKPQGRVVHDENDNSLFYEALYMSLGIGYFTGFWGVVGPILLWRHCRIAYMRFLNRLTDHVYVMVVLNVAMCHERIQS